MKIVFNIVLAILVFLAISSGVTKVLLMQQDVTFFAPYGFTNALLIAYGAVQMLGGILLVLPKTRAIGAAVVAVTFFISLVILVMAGNIPVAMVTLICIALLLFIIRQTSHAKLRTPDIVQ